MFKIETNEFNQNEIIKNGNKFMIGNGYFGYRGTLEEFSRDQMVAFNMAGLYDQNGTKWRESVNAFNPLYTYLKVGSIILNPLKIAPIRHAQWIDMENGTHYRQTTFFLDNTEITISAERFPGQANIHLLILKYSFTVSKPITVDLMTGIDSSVYDINGPHLENLSFRDVSGAYSIIAETQEQKLKLSVSEIVKNDFDAESETLLINGMAMRRFRVAALPGQVYTIIKYTAIDHTWADAEEKARTAVLAAAELGYDTLVAENLAFWKNKWNFSDIEIKGSEEAQIAIRNSIYHLIIIRPYSETRGIPARGVSGQVYKGAVFWDTEMFMLPFYLNTDLDSARKIIMYRVHTLEGAQKKAKEYGFRGAFYAWESQDNGNDACSDFNVTDAETGVPIRTYFREKQIHISGDIVYAIDKYVKQTNDTSVLLEGGLKMMIECARFYQSYVTNVPENNRYEVRDVIGPDEYHERVDNNAFTNKMIANTFETTIKTIKMMRGVDSKFVVELIRENAYEDDLDAIKIIWKSFFVPAPGPDYVIEQFNGYSKLEDIDLAKLKKRIKHPNEYLGGPTGVATPTKIIKQADVVTMLTLFRADYTKIVKTANWKYYEPRTEHGSSLSASMYALLACEIGQPENAWPLFLKTASIDISGEGKMYAGGIYIGGTHPASSGGAYMTAVYGFAGLRHLNGLLGGETRLPSGIQEMRFKCMEMGKIANVTVKNSGVRITWEKRQDIHAVIFNLDGVIVSTERYHYQAWKNVADREGIDFNETINNRLRGVSRMESLDIILEKSKRKYTQTEKNNMAAFKNAEYISLLDNLTTADILPGLAVTLAFLKSKKIKTAVASSSKNARTILEKTNLTTAFDAVVDGSEISMTKPHPEIFLKAASKLGFDPEHCVVVEDAISGIQAAKAGGMFAVGIQDAQNSPLVDWKIDELSDLIKFL
jgi:nigerose phosphorylase